MLADMYDKRLICWQITSKLLSIDTKGVARGERGEFPPIWNSTLGREWTPPPLFISMFVACPYTFKLSYFRRGGKKMPPPFFSLYLMHVKISLKGKTFLRGGENEKAPNPTIPSFPVLDDNICKVYVYIMARNGPKYALFGPIFIKISK